MSYVFSPVGVRLPPSYAPFPYTTLFRSRVDGALRVVVVQLDLQRVAGVLLLHYGEQLVYGCHGLPVDRGEDRKSTRLNSSHVEWSYAVFCLKKKIKKKTTTMHSTTLLLR